MKENPHTSLELSLLSEIEELIIYGGRSIKRNDTYNGCTVHESDCVVYQQCDIPKSDWDYKKIEKKINKNHI